MNGNLIKAKALVVCIVFLAVFAFGQSVIAKDKTLNSDISGCWDVVIYSVDSKGDTGDNPEENQIWVKHVVDDRYWGWVCNIDPVEEGRNFSAVVDGADVYITHWDSLTKATLDKEGDSFSGINQAFDADPRGSKTSFATATRMADGDCTACPPTVACDNGVQDGDESDVDCGGSCDVCVNGDNCNVDLDCVHQMCINWVCSGGP